MSGAKKKSRTDKIPKPIAIKKEKTEEDRTLHPISHYIDDRLEMVKQVFGTLKPKTIRNLAPEFLKTTELDEIEELCLHELLCVSTKRLKSIINGTTCPTDTESSEDSDVEHKEEHISLEEISSDSNLGDPSRRRAKKKKQITRKTTKTSEEVGSTKPISVLELLELQARARAIRSQLAMEPITKIEVDSDVENAAEQDQSLDGKTSKQSSGGKSESKRQSGEKRQAKTSTKTHPHTNGKNNVTDGTLQNEVVNSTKKIKLKRNYRRPSKTTDIENHTTPATVLSIEPTNELKPSTSRSPSPDVIPIQSELVTLLISDNSEDGGTKLSVMDKDKLSTENKTNAEPSKPVQESEPEEGEVTDESETEATRCIQETVVEKETEPAADNTPGEIVRIGEAAITSEQGGPTPVTDLSSGMDDQIPANTSGKALNMAENIADDEDQNDDVISIGGDLENEMIEELAKEDEKPTTSVKSEAVEVPPPYEDDNDVILLDTSEDEHEKLGDINSTTSESWRTRYLKSSKVSQVLAFSRLGKRVRDKIIKSNRAKKRIESKMADDIKEGEAQHPFISKHEDGSIEQYQELLQHRQRKSSNSSKGEK